MVTPHPRNLDRKYCIDDMWLVNYAMVNYSDHNIIDTMEEKVKVKIKTIKLFRHQKIIIVFRRWF